MKLTLALLLVLLAPAVAAQEGTVLYEQTVKIEIQLPPEVAARMRDQIPSSQTASKVLLFTETASLMKEAPKEKENEAMSSGMNRFFRMMSPPDNQTYIDFDAETRVERKDFMGRTFLVTGETPALAWRLTGEQAEFLGYPCQKAVATRDSTQIEAWFTSQIPVPAGPEEYGGLPGLILLVTEDGGRRSIVAKEVTLAPLAAGSVVAPTEGRRVTRDEYDRIVKEKLEEMRQTYGGRGGSITIRQN